MEKPFTFEKLTINQSEVHFLMYTDFDYESYLPLLSSVELARFNQFKSDSRKKEFLAVRILKQELFGNVEIRYTEIGAPYIKNAGYISISHCNDCVGIAVNQNYKVGMDLESYRSNILSLKDKFLSDSERNSFDINNNHEVTRIWSAKEALYKLAGRKRIIFSTELLLEKRGNDIYGEIDNHDHSIFVNLASIEQADKIITINTEPIEVRYK